MRTIKSGILLASAVSLLALSACNKADKPAAAAPAAATSQTEVTVNGVAISQAAVDAMLKQRLQGQPPSPEARAAIIEGMVLEAVVAQEGAKIGLDKAPEFVEQMDTIRRSALANAYVEDFLKKNPVTDEAVKAEYDRQAASVGSEYKARHILVEKEDEAKAIIATLQKTSAAFAKLAKDKSKDPGSKASGGDLGWFDAQQMVPEFGAALAKLEKGKFTEEPVKTQFGYHIILLDDLRKVEPPPLEALKAQLSQQLTQQSVQKQLDVLKTAAKVELAASAAAAASAASGAK